MQENKKSTLGYELLLLITAAIWGSGFVAQRYGMESLQTFSFNSARFLLGSISLIPVLLIRKTTFKSVKKTFIPSLITGLCLFMAASFQQASLIFTSTSKAGFISGLYVAFVPIVAIFLKKKTPLKTWIGVFLCLLGMYFLSFFEGINNVNYGDMLALFGSFCWTAHVLCIDYWSPKIDSLCFASMQFAVCGIISGILAAFFEKPGLNDFINCTGPLLYNGLVSVGIAYTIQAVAQKKAHPARASIIMSMESPFTFFFGYIILHERIKNVEIIGCVLMLCGALIAQIPNKKKKVIEEDEKINSKELQHS